MAAPILSAVGVGGKGVYRAPAAACPSRPGLLSSPPGPAPGGGHVLSSALFPGGQGPDSPRPHRRGGGRVGREARPVNSSFPAPPRLNSQALPRRKIQLVSSNCSAEEPEKGRGKGIPPPAAGVCAGRGLRSREPAQAPASLPPVLRVSLHGTVCQCVPPGPRVPPSFPAQAQPPSPSAPMYTPESPLQALGSKGRGSLVGGRSTWRVRPPTSGLLLSARCAPPSRLRAGFSPVLKHCRLLAGPLHRPPRPGEPPLQEACSSVAQSFALPSSLGFSEQPESPPAGRVGAVLPGCLCPSAQCEAWHWGGALEMLTESEVQSPQACKMRCPVSAWRTPMHPAMASL